MESLSSSQVRLRSHVETVIAVASPLLDAVLAVGDRISRLAEPRDYEYYPVREDQADIAPAEPPRGDRAGGDDQLQGRPR